MWYYSINGQRNGPVDESTLIRMVNSSQVGPEVLVWTQGMSSWVRLSQTQLASRLRLPQSMPPDIRPSYPAGAMVDQKDRTAYVLLAVLLGIGVHNLYAGYTTRGVIQLVAVFGSCFILWIPVWIWCIIEAIAVTEDGKGVRFK